MSSITLVRLRRKFLDANHKHSSEEQVEQQWGEVAPLSEALAYSHPRFQDAHVFFGALLTRGIVFYFPGTITPLPRGQRRRNLRQRTRHFSMKTLAWQVIDEKVITTPLEVM